MFQVKLSPTARSNVIEILDWSAKKFGPAARARYQQLISQGLKDIADDPNRFGSQSVLGFEPVRVFHLRYSRARVQSTAGSVRSPRHVIAYRQVGPDMIEVVSILHDAMDLMRHLPKP